MRAATNSPSPSRNLRPNNSPPRGGDLIDGTIGGFFAKTVSGFGATLSDVNDRVDDETDFAAGGADAARFGQRAFRRMKS